jgi:hypothetical protein
LQIYFIFYSIFDFFTKNTEQKFLFASSPLEVCAHNGEREKFTTFGKSFSFFFFHFECSRTQTNYANYSNSFEEERKAKTTPLRDLLYLCFAFLRFRLFFCWPSFVVPLIEEVKKKIFGVTKRKEKGSICSFLSGNFLKKIMSHCHSLVILGSKNKFMLKAKKQ